MSINFETIEPTRPIISGLGGVELHFVIGKKSPRIKPINFSGLTEGERVQRLTHYSQAHRLVRVIEVSNLLMQAFISPDAPFVEDLQRSQDLTIGDKKVSQVQVLTEQEYQDFTAQALNSVKASSEELASKEEKKPVDGQISVVSSRTAKSISQFIRVTSIPLKVAAKVQESSHRSIMQMLEQWGEAQRRLADFAKEKAQAKREERKLILELYEAASRIAYDIKMKAVSKKLAA